MAGPGSKGGRPRRGHEQMDQWLLEAKVLNLYDRNYKLREIGAEVGLHFTTVREMLQRINRRGLAEFDREAVRAAKMRQYLRIENQLTPLVINERGEEDFRPDLVATNHLLKVIRAECQLMGADAPNHVEIRMDQERGDAGEVVANSVARFVDLADQLARSGYDSDPEVEVAGRGRGFD
jgi:hypothetical protein